MINQSVSPIGRVMVVDDEPQNRELLRDLLHAHGHSVIEAQDGQEALHTPIVFGRTSVNYVEVVSGLKEGDQVVLSDTSTLDSYNRIRLR